MPVGRGWLGAGSRAGSWEQSGSGTERAELWYLFSVQGQQRWLRSGVGNEGKKLRPFLNSIWEVGKRDRQAEKEPAFGVR